MHSVLSSFFPFPLLPLSLCILVKENFIFLVTQASNFEVSFFPNIVYRSPSTNSVGSTSDYIQLLITPLHHHSSPSHHSSCLVCLPPASLVSSHSFFSAQLPEHLVKTKLLRSWPSLLKTLQGLPFSLTEKPEAYTGS